MKSFLVIGMGRFGSALAAELFDMGHEIMVIDSDDEKLSQVADRATHAVIGDAKDIGVLKAAGIRNFDCVVVALTQNLEDSILITLQLKELEAKYVVCKAKNEHHAKVLKLLGADRIVMPEMDMGRRTAHQLAQDNIIDFIELSPDYSLIDLPAPKKWVDKSIKQLDIRNNYGATVIAIQNKITNEINTSPNAGTFIGKDDIVVLVGSTEDLQAIGDIK